MAIYKPAELELTGRLPEEIKYQGTVYLLAESGRVGISEVNGTAVNNTENSAKYWQYHDNSGGYVIYIENRGGKREISCGYCIKTHELRLIRKLRAIY